MVLMGVPLWEAILFKGSIGGVKKNYVMLVQYQ